MRQLRKFKRTDSTLSPNAFIQALTLTEIFERFMVYKRTQGLAPRTLEEYEVHFQYLLNYLDGDIPPTQITTDTMLGYVTWMVHDQGLAPMTVNIRIRTLRAFLRFAFLENHISTPIHEKLQLQRTDEDTIQSFTPTEVKSLLSRIDTSSYVGFRDFVMVCTLLDSMVRIAELLTIKRTNIDIKQECIALEAGDTKTRRSRVVPVSSKTCKLIKQYMRETEDFENDTLFLSYDGRPLLANSWRRRLSEYGEQAGIATKRVSPHTFRHTGALFYILNGGDPFSLQKILGHSDMSMVRKYIQMTNADVKRQHNSFSPLKHLKL